MTHYTLEEFLKEDVINNYEETEVDTLLLNVPTLTEDDLVSIFQRLCR